MGCPCPAWVDEVREEASPPGAEILKQGQEGGGGDQDANKYRQDEREMAVMVFYV